MQLFGFLFVLAALLAACSCQLAAAEIVCPQDQPDDSLVIQFPSPTTCEAFYKCNRGVAVLNKCPPGLHYNPNLQVCDFPSRAGCVLE